MIEFRGQLSKEAQIFLSRKITKTGTLLISAAFAIVLIPILWLCLTLNYWYILVGYISIYLIILLVGTLIWNSSKSLHACTPERILINQDKLISYTSQHKNVQYCKDVKCVIDQNEWYYFEFVFGKRSLEFICQKNLLTRGTLEEFEELFRGKIIKKKDKAL